MKDQDQSFVIPQAGIYHFVKLEEIIRMQAEGSYVNIFLKGGKKLLSSKNIGHFRNLQPAGFFISHKSHMINVAHLTSYSKEGTLTMVDGSSVPISRRRKDAFMQEVINALQPNDIRMGVVKKLDIEWGKNRKVN